MAWNCDVVKRADLLSWAESGRAESLPAEAHLMDCPACRRRAEAWRAHVHVLRSLAALAPPADLSSPVVETRFAQIESRIAVGRGRASAAQRTGLVAWAQAAAVVALVAGAALASGYLASRSSGRSQVDQDRVTIVKSSDEVEELVEVADGTGAFFWP